MNYKVVWIIVGNVIASATGVGDWDFTAGMAVASVFAALCKKVEWI